MLSIVMLLRQPRRLELHEVQDAVERAFKENHKVAQIPNRPGFGVQLPEMVLGLLNSVTPYFEDVAAAADRISDVASRDAVQEHLAWISVDLVGNTWSVDRRKGYAAIGKLVAQLIDENVVALMCLPQPRVVAYDGRFLPLLSAGKGEEIFKPGAVAKILPLAGGDPELAAAADEARRRFPEFAQAFTHRRPGQHFAIKKRFTDGKEVEHMWIEVFSIEGAKIHGRLANNPKYHPSMKIDQSVLALDWEVEDWMYGDGTQDIGGFQAEVLKKRGQR